MQFVDDLAHAIAIGNPRVAKSSLLQQYITMQNPNMVGQLSQKALRLDIKDCLLTYDAHRDALISS